MFAIQGEEKVAPTLQRSGQHMEVLEIYEMDMGVKLFRRGDRQQLPVGLSEVGVEASQGWCRKVSPKQIECLQDDEESGLGGKSTQPACIMSRAEPPVREWAPATSTEASKKRVV